MKATLEAHSPAVDYSCLEFKSSAGDHNAWLISYLDIFILTAALFASLLAYEQTKQEAITSPTSATAPLAQYASDRTPKNLAKVSAENAAATSVGSPLSLLLGLLPAFSNPFSPANDYNFTTATESKPPMKDQWQNDTIITMQRHAFDNKIQIEFKKGYAEMSIGSAVLFAVSEANLLESGTQVLTDLIGFLQEAEGMIVIQGHTDSSPISSAVYPSNWELASARANNVLHFLLASGLKRERLRAVSFADTKPLVANDSEANRQKNRRVNIVLLSPEISDPAYKGL